MFGWLRGQTGSGEVRRLLAEIEQVLLKAAPLAARAAGVEEPAYATFLSFIDTTTDDITPFVMVVPERLRAWMLRWDPSDAGNKIWRLPELMNMGCAERLTPEFTGGYPLRSKLNECYRVLTADGSLDDSVQLIPVRETFRRAAFKLNDLDWTKFLTPTEDFAVVATDWSGFWVAEDAPPSLPPAKLARLKDRRLFFPETTGAEQTKLAERYVAIEVAVAGKPIADRVMFWLRQLDAVANGKPCPLVDLPWDLACLVERIEDLGGAASVPLVDIAKRFDRLPMNEQGLPTAASMAMKAAFRAIIAIGRPTRKLEERLRELLAASIAANEGREYWSGTPFNCAYTLSQLFDYPWPTSDHWNKLSDRAAYLDSPLKTKA